MVPGSGRIRRFPAPRLRTRTPAELVTDPTALKQLRLLWLSVGNHDDFFRLSKGMHD
jgi:hypothetical protein